MMGATWGSSGEAARPWGRLEICSEYGWKPLEKFEQRSDRI